MRRRLRWPIAALALLSLIWGYNWVVMKVALAHAGPITVAALRFTLAPLCLMPLMLRRGERLYPTRQQWPPVAILGIALAVNFALTFSALESSGTGKTAVLVYTMPFWVLAFAWLALHERLRRLQIAAGALALVGLLILIQPWSLGGGLVPSAMAVAAGMSWGASIVYVKRLQAERSISMMMLTVWQMIVAAIVLLAGAWLLERDRSVSWSAEFFAALVFTVILATGVAWMLFYYALRRLSASMTGLGTLATPVVGAFGAWLQLGETPSLIEGSGMLLIGVGLALLTWAAPEENGKRRPEVQAALDSDSLD